MKKFKLVVVDEETGDPVEISARGREFKDFAEGVLEHVETYTVPQYGDAPNDNVESWTPEIVVKQMSKYLARVHTNARGPKETIRDMFKIAHYAAIAATKIGKFLV